MDSRWRLEGKRALITGGTRGIGRAVAEELLHLGALVTIVARNKEEITTTLCEWSWKRLSGRGIAADVTLPEIAPRIVAAAEQQMGGLDILINNVGTNIRRSSVEYSAEEFQKVLTTNLTSAWEMCRAAHATLAASRGCVVMVGSVAGQVHVGSGAPYAMTKAALDQLTRYLAVEWAPEGIRVNAVEPWYTNTPLAAPVLEDEERRARIVERTPLGRIAEPEDVAAAAAFLCMPAARHITGICLPVDGGFLASGA